MLNLDSGEKGRIRDFDTAVRIVPFISFITSGVE